MMTAAPTPTADIATEASDPGATIIQMPGLPRKEQRRSQDKWSAQVMKRGYTPLPSLLLQAQALLGLKPEQLNTLLQIIEHWWDAGKMPFPSKETLARRMGKSTRQVQRYLTQLEEGGFIERVERFTGLNAQTSNGYNLAGLVAKLQAIEPAFSKVTEQNRLRRKRVETPTGEGA